MPTAAKVLIVLVILLIIPVIIAIIGATFKDTNSADTIAALERWKAANRE